MKALTIHQPYAWAMMLQTEGKVVENRSWSTPYRGEFWVHAGKQWWDADAQWIRDEFGLLVPGREDMAFGAILGTVELVDVVQDADMWTEWARPGSYHWMLSHPKPLDEPILNVTGRQGWWSWEAP